MGGYGLEQLKLGSGAEAVIAKGVAVAVIGGTVSVIGGGKFANGAATAAFVYLFNECSTGKCTFWEKVGAFGDGAASVGTGVYNAGRFVARGIGAMGPDEQARWVLEGEVMDAAIDAYATNPEIRDQMNAKGFETLRQIIRDNQDGYLKWHFTGRVATGVVVSPFGFAAILGDMTRAVENRHDAVDAMIRGGFLGRPEPKQ